MIVKKSTGSAGHLLRLTGFELICKHLLALSFLLAIKYFQKVNVFISFLV